MEGTNGFKVGDRVTWNYEAREGYGHVTAVPGVVTKLSGTRVEIAVPSQSKPRTRPWGRLPYLIRNGAGSRDG